MLEKSDTVKRARTLFAVLVGVTEYSEKYARLPGGAHDLADLESYLHSYCKSANIGLNPLVLKDKNATREAIINAFALFDSAEGNDICLFYFTGHGARKVAPVEFWKEADRYNETIVCYEEGGADHMLIDKELSYLIAKASAKEKNLHFLVITDCCHSGSNSKSMDFTTKSIPFDKVEKEAKFYYGYEQYKSMVFDGQKYPPLANHFKLSACHASQKALQKSFELDGQTVYRSVFTYSLLQTLRATDGKLSYQNLIGKIKINLNLLVPEQTPQLETIGLDPREKNTSFLDGIFSNAEPVFQVSHHPLQGWIVNTGSLYGLTPSDKVLIREDAPIKISKTNTDYSLLFPGLSQARTMDKGTVYDAKILHAEGAFRKMKISFSPDSDPVAKNYFVKALSDKQTPYVEMVYSGAEFIIHARENYYALAYVHEMKPIFKRVAGFNDWGARLFLKQMETMAKWHRIVNLSAQNSMIQEKDVQITLERIDEPFRSNYLDESAIETVDDWSDENIFRYHYEHTPHGSLWHCPAFRLKISNRTNPGEKLWFGALYCGSDFDFSDDREKTLLFSLSSRFLEPVKIDPGGSVYLEDIFTNPVDQRKFPIKTIQLHVLDDYFDQGYNEIRDFIKVFVSTDEFDLTNHNMRGLEMDPEKMAIVRPALDKDVPPANWRSYEIPVTIVRPKDFGNLLTHTEFDLGRLILKGHRAFTAIVILSTFSELSRSVKNRSIVTLRPEDYFTFESLNLFTITEGLGLIDGRSVIELYHVQDEELVNEAVPIVLKIKERLPKGRTVIPVGYDHREVNCYKTIGYCKWNHIYITSLPIPSPSEISNLGDSVKIFFLEVNKKDAKQLNAIK